MENDGKPLFLGSFSAPFLGPAPRLHAEVRGHRGQHAGGRLAHGAALPLASHVEDEQSEASLLQTIDL